MAYRQQQYDHRSPPTYPPQHDQYGDRRDYRNERQFPPPRQDYRDDRAYDREYGRPPFHQEDARRYNDARDQQPYRHSEPSYHPQGMRGPPPQLSQRNYDDRRPYNSQPQAPYMAPQHSNGRHSAASMSPPRTPAAPLASAPAGAAGGPRPMSTPSQSVILLSLPQLWDETMIRSFLEDMGCAIDTITLIHDKETGLSKRFAFARFVSVEHARSFVEPNYPSVVWRDRTGRGMPGDEGTIVKVDFSQTDRPPKNAVGKTSFAVPDKTAEPAKPPSGPPAPPNNGERDIGPAPSATLLLRGLDPLTREAEIAAALDNQPTLINAVKNGEGAARMVMHVKDRTAKTSLCFAFVTYKDAQAALKVLTSLWDPDLHPQGFRIRGHTVTATFAHNESFRPAYATSQFSFKNETGKDMLYWDDKAYVVVWSSPSLATKVDDEDTDAFFASIGPAAAATTSNGPSIASSSSSTTTTTTAPTRGLLDSKPGESRSSPARSSRPAQDRPPASSTNGSSRSAAKPAPIDTATAQAHQKRKAPDLIASKKAAPDIAKWNNVKKDVDAVVPEPLTTGQKRKVEVGEGGSTDDGYPFGNPVQMTCLLCQRQFQTIEQLDKHNRLSELHRGNLLNPELVRLGQEKKTASLAVAAAEYRDRAAERRSTTGQPDRPLLDDASSIRKRPKHEPPAPTPSRPQKIEETNIGHRMLAASGWNEREGMGMNGAGRLAPVEARMYASGAGLGAHAGVDVSQRSNEAWNAPSTGRDKARERYQQG